MLEFGYRLSHALQVIGVLVRNPRMRRTDRRLDPNSDVLRPSDFDLSRVTVQPGETGALISDAVMAGLERARSLLAAKELLFSSSGGLARFLESLSSLSSTTISAAPSTRTLRRPRGSLIGVNESVLAKGISYETVRGTDDDDYIASVVNARGGIDGLPGAVVDERDDDDDSTASERLHHPLSDTASAVSAVEAERTGRSSILAISRAEFDLLVSRAAAAGAASTSTYTSSSNVGIHVQRLVKCVFPSTRGVHGNHADRFSRYRQPQAGASEVDDLADSISDSLFTVDSRVVSPAVYVGVSAAGASTRVVGACVGRVESIIVKQGAGRPRSVCGRSELQTYRMHACL